MYMFHDKYLDIGKEVHDTFLLPLFVISFHIAPNNRIGKKLAYVREQRVNYFSKDIKLHELLLTINCRLEVLLLYNKYIVRKLRGSLSTSAHVNIS
ncbi:hypothetical protein Glove_280g69 [Diversispora epigaea]|uniref:Uncharacterized protein n=1 Tax=Diversispora epigaea TaxID=1348612 RepID=A0A397IA65_9GLOM|nr:hypothetical protein Glove_280g69 [Diversispora epigaea]